MKKKLNSIFTGCTLGESKLISQGECNEVFTDQWFGKGMILSLYYSVLVQMLEIIWPLLPTESHQVANSYC